MSVPQMPQNAMSMTTLSSVGMGSEKSRRSICTALVTRAASTSVMMAW
jgi:hypothetical protein